MIEPTQIKGSLVALVTPFADGVLDEPALRGLVRWHVEAGSAGLVPVGTTGESALLSEEEHRRVVDVVVDECAGRLPVVAGAGSNNPAEAILYSNHAATSGADAALHVAGYFVRPDQEGLAAHFTRVHDETDLPFIVYNIPPRAIVDVLPETLATLAALPRLIGVKDATGDLSRPLKERALIDKPFAYLSGEDATAVAYNVSGGSGCISVTANVAPRHCAEMQEACDRGDFARAAEIQDRLLPLHLALFAEPSPAGAKYAVSLLGHCAPDCRLPVMPLKAATKDAIRRAMVSLELL